MAKLTDYGEGSFIHPRFNGSANTPADLIKAFWQSNNKHKCKVWRCTLTFDECLKRRARAKAAKRIVVVNSQCTTMAGDEYQRLKLCVKCKSYPR